jgi:CheY-like chemotaxis protein
MPETTHRCAVLIVDDDADSQEMLRLALHAAGYTVSIAANGRDALTHLRSTADTCIIILDLSLPQMDGAHFRAAQLRDRSFAWIPVVVLSGSIDGATHARELGARAFVPKPVDLDRLRAALRRIGCCQARPRSGPPRDTAELATVPDTK